ncbi:MAG: glycosyltransferase family 2 protein [Bdellovibrio sp.]|nr:glycosyltransferase family 2 protein [Bdellovibrio sp.]
MCNTSYTNLSITVITYNEEKNISRCLESVSWASELIVIDCGSTDKTVEIAKTLGAKIYQQEWFGYGKQKNFAQSKTMHDWVLNLDADEVISSKLKKEILYALNNTLINQPDIKGFSFPRKTYYLGQWIRFGGWYPDCKIRLVNKHSAIWTEPEVHEDLIVKGKTVQMQNPIEHYSFYSIEEQVKTNIRFAKLGALELKKKKSPPNYFYLIFKPLGKFIEAYFWKFGFLDGLPGFIIATNAAYSIFLKYAYMQEDKIRNASSHN